jgi:hypothetical protein
MDDNTRDEEDIDLAMAHQSKWTSVEDVVHTQKRWVWFLAERLHSHGKPQERRSRETRYVCIFRFSISAAVPFIAIVQAAPAGGSPALAA